MDRGELVGDDVMIGIVRERLERPDAQRRVRARRVSAHGGAGGGARPDHGRARGPLIVVDIVVPEDELVRRLATRRICGELRRQRADRRATTALRQVRRRAGAARPTTTRRRAASG